MSGGTVRPLSRPRPPQRNGQSGIKESGHKQRKSYQKKNGTIFGDFPRSLMGGEKHKFHRVLDL